MGRNKIKIEKIDSERKRTATYTKRSHGLIKKAMELSILCECEVSLFIFANDKLVVYSSKDVKDTLIKFVEFKSNYFSYSNQDYPAICHTTSIPEDLSEQRVAAGTTGLPEQTPLPKEQPTTKETAPPSQHAMMANPLTPPSSSQPPNYYEERRNAPPPPSYAYEQQRMQNGNEMIPGDYNHQEQSGYPYMRGYGNTQQYNQMHPYANQPYKQVDPKLKDPMNEDGPKKPQDHH